MCLFSNTRIEVKYENKIGSFSFAIFSLCKLQLVSSVNMRCCTDFIVSSLLDIASLKGLVKHINQQSIHCYSIFVFRQMRELFKHSSDRCQ